jgi:hypothetical protein
VKLRDGRSWRGARTTNGLAGLLTRRSSTAILVAVKKSICGASGAQGLSIVIQKNRQLMMQEKLGRISQTVPSVEPLALQPDLRSLWNTSSDRKRVATLCRARRWPQSEMVRAPRRARCCELRLKRLHHVRHLRAV